jgi:hypothetical protein
MIFPNDRSGVQKRRDLRFRLMEGSWINPGHRHFVLRVRLQYGQQFLLIAIVRIDPGRFPLFGHHDRHPVMDGSHESIGFCRDDRAGMDGLLFRRDPGFIKTRKTKRLSRFKRETKRFPDAVAYLPFIEPVGHNQATSFLEGISEARFLRQGFRSRIEHPVPYGRVFGP